MGWRAGSMPADLQAAYTVGKMGGEFFADGFAAIQEHAVAACDLAMDGPRHHIARRQFGIVMHRRHEALTLLVDQHGAFAAQGFRRQRRGIAADIDCGGMKLDKFGIGDQCARARRHAQAFAARFQRIGGDGIERAQTAGGEDHRACLEQDQPRIRAGSVAGEQAHHLAVLHRQFDGMKAFHDPDGRRCQRPRGQGARNLRPGPVARDMHDTRPRMRRLAAQRQQAARIAVERRPHRHQVGDAVRRFLRHQIDDRRIAKTGAGRDRVRGMVAPVIAFADRSRNAALGPGAGPGGTGARSRQHQGREGRQFQRREQTGNAGAQDQCAVGLDHIVDAMAHGITP